MVTKAGMASDHSFSIHSGVVPDTPEARREAWIWHANESYLVTDLATLSKAPHALSTMSLDALRTHPSTELL